MAFFCHFNGLCVAAEYVFLHTLQKYRLITCPSDDRLYTPCGRAFDGVQHAFPPLFS